MLVNLIFVHNLTTPTSERTLPQVVTVQPQVEKYLSIVPEGDLGDYLFCHSIKYFFSRLYFFSERGGNVVYVIYGTWSHIHSHLVTQPYIGLINSSI